MSHLPPCRVKEIRHAVLEWQRRHGRHCLPWQLPATPYRVWVSEVMLQQTRVEAVVPYFDRFIAHFPDARALAAADIDRVLALWAGLGYYSRARNLHAAAQRIAERHGGEPPSDLLELRALPGIGPSTAGAIRSLGHGLPAAILDGNVKRVLARLFAVAGWPGRSATARRLWSLSEALVCPDEPARFNQGLMDLGASICTPKAPTCLKCPIAFSCRAYIAGETEALPEPRPGRRRPLREIGMLIIEGNEGVFLERRPPSGIWGGLWSLPECPLDTDPAEAARRLGIETVELERCEVIRHGFTHFELLIHPIRLRLTGHAPQACDREGTRWHRSNRGIPTGLPAPVTRMLRERSG